MRLSFPVVVRSALLGSGCKKDDPSGSATREEPATPAATGSGSPPAVAPTPTAYEPAKLDALVFDANHVGPLTKATAVNLAELQRLFPGAVVERKTEQAKGEAPKASHRGREEAEEGARHRGRRRRQGRERHRRAALIPRHHWIMVCGVAACGAPARPAALTNRDHQHVTLEWHAAQGSGEQVSVSIIVSGHRFRIGTLNAASDDEPGTPKTCRILSGGTSSTAGFVCGVTPAYNLYEAEIDGGDLVITLVTGVDGNEGSETHREVKRVPITGTTLQVAPYSPTSR